jgi:hypothetical protein
MLGTAVWPSCHSTARQSAHKHGHVSDDSVVRHHLTKLGIDFLEACHGSSQLGRGGGLRENFVGPVNAAAQLLVSQEGSQLLSPTTWRASG